MIKDLLVRLLAASLVGILLAVATFCLYINVAMFVDWFIKTM